MKLRGLRKICKNSYIFTQTNFRRENLFLFHRFQVYNMLYNEKTHVEESDHATMEGVTTHRTDPDEIALEETETEVTVDTVAPSAIGGDFHDLPEGYYRSPKFIGSFVGVVFMAWSLYVGYVLPSSTLSIINADLGTCRISS
jgi:hypothetical protein